MRKLIRAAGIAACVAPALAPASAVASVDVFPAAGSHLASPATQISLRGATPRALRSVSVRGSRSGSHSFVLKAHSDGQGASLLPRRPFRPGELVTVRAPGGVALTGAVGGAVKFRIARFAAMAHVPIPDPGGRTPGGQRVHSDHSLAPPRLIVRGRSGPPAPGLIFTGPHGGDGPSGPMITDDNGGLVWFKPLSDGQGAFDFRVQRYKGRPVLTWWQGSVFLPGEGTGEGVIYDSAYRFVAHVRAGNGYTTDLHEFELTPRGTALVVANQPVQWRGGPAIDGVVQEIDVATGLVEFEWHSLDHVDTADSFFRRPRRAPFDYIHVNAVQEQPDGTLLISGRNTSTVYDVDGHDGHVVWRLGGRHSDFKLGPGAGFVAQHDARRAADGTISIFDNGSPPVTKRAARGIVLALDTTAHTATLVRAFGHSPGLVSGSQGSVQPLDGGDYLVGWGSRAWITEYDAAGHVRLDAQFSPSTDNSYRAYRLPWSGRPAAAPRAAASTTGGETIVWASWNGATGVTGWRVLAGDVRGKLRRVAEVPTGGFETRIVIPGAPRFVRVQPVARSGHALSGSRTAQTKRL
jgi:hypothetical protein